jgi:hypothetical protein
MRISRLSELFLLLVHKPQKIIRSRRCFCQQHL